MKAGKHKNGNDIYLKNGRFGPYLQYEKIPEEKTDEKIIKKKRKILIFAVFAENL